MKKCHFFSVALIIIVIPLFCGAQKQALINAKDYANQNSKDKQGKDQVPPLRELCILNYKTDFSTLADKIQGGSFPQEQY